MIVYITITTVLIFKIIKLETDLVQLKKNREDHGQTPETLENKSEDRVVKIQKLESLDQKLELVISEQEIKQDNLATILLPKISHLFAEDRKKIFDSFVSASETEYITSIDKCPKSKSSFSYLPDVTPELLSIGYGFIPESVIISFLQEVGFSASYAEYIKQIIPSALSVLEKVSTLFLHSSNSSGSTKKIMTKHPSQTYHERSIDYTGNLAIEIIKDEGNRNKILNFTAVSEATTEFLSPLLGAAQEESSELD
ncbi:MAG: hypothetical protein SFT93_01190 [Rickettsiaceae bacterium]|nr:hypothetical protein [Rickettsiaceae bacterium]